MAVVSHTQKGVQQFMDNLNRVSQAHGMNINRTLWNCCDSSLSGLMQLIFYATADEADANMFYRCFFLFFSVFCFFLSVTKIPDNRSRERLNGFS